MKILSREGGFSLMEVMVALSIFGIVAGGMTPGFASLLKYNTGAELKTQAMGAAQKTLDFYRLQDITTLPISGAASQTYPIDGKNYVVTVRFCQNPAYCVSDTIRHISAEVTYNGIIQFKTETIFSQLR